MTINTYTSRGYWLITIYALSHHRHTRHHRSGYGGKCTANVLEKYVQLLEMYVNSCIFAAINVPLNTLST